MIVYVSFKVSMNDLWLKDAMEIEALRLQLLEQARRLHAQRVKEGHRPDEGDVEVERVESIGGGRRLTATALCGLARPRFSPHGGLPRELALRYAR